MPSPPSSCLTDEVLMALLDKELSGEALARVHRHAAGCSACEKLLARLAHTLSWTPPDQFDEFRLERLIGRGGMGVVYLAYDTTLDRHVAVKFIASGEPEPWVREYFDTEARVIARLQHPNVVSVFRVGQADGQPYIVSEYVDGKSLTTLERPVEWRRALALGVGLARGLAAAHRQGVLHRDLKPSNAIVSRDGEVKLLDFGLAQRFEPGGAPVSSTQLVGTLSYLAPELLGHAPATPQSDIYSLGLILRELCTGEVPQPMDRRLIDPDFAAIIERCLAPNPLERFASAEALCEALERLQWISAPPPLVDGNPYRGLAPFEAEHRTLFFGRDADIRAVLERLRHRPMVLVAGDSGAGKSSLCRAGVLPRVAAGALDDGRERLTVTLWPGHRPLETLAAALAPLLGRNEAEFVTALAENPAWLGRVLREVHQGGQRLLLFIDQLEELITISEPAQAAHFARILGELALPSAGGRVLLAVRGDFLTRLSALPGLGEEAERALYILRPMAPEGVREAIVGPARSRGVAFESEELVQTLVASTAQGVGSLPLLQFALAELWERRNPAQGRITQAALDAMGGVAGALSRHADGVLSRLGPAEREAARRLLLRLVTVEGTRIERGEEELIEPADEASRTALRALVDGRLLHTRTVGGQPRCEIAHDSLIQNWGTLRDWLDGDIGQRVVHKRVEEASAEWKRLGQAKEALWGQRQLDEARLLDPSALGTRERAFLDASRRAMARQRWGRWLAALGVVLAIAASYGSLRFQAYLEDTSFIAAQIHEAQEALAEGKALAQQAATSREETLALFDGWPSGTVGPKTSADREKHKKAATEQWVEVLRLHDRADEAYAHASQVLEKALDRDRSRADTRSLLAQVLYERVLLAEEFHQARERNERLQRLEQVVSTGEAGVEWLQKLMAQAELEITTDPPGAHVEIKRYIDDQGKRRLEQVPETGSLGPTPIARVLLREGSYLLTFSQPGRKPVKLPLLLTHGAQERVRLTLPPEVPAGYVYIPAGCFLLGSAEPEVMRNSMHSPPIHEFCLPNGYLIGQTEVTFGDWLAYLNSPQGAKARGKLEEPSSNSSGKLMLRQQPGEGWTFSFHRSSEAGFMAKEDEHWRYPKRTRRNTADWRRFPLSGVSAKELEGYFSWLDSTGRLPGARLCTQHEWEYAARGADGRVYPHGDQLKPDDANIDETYDREPMNFGPDEVGAHPASVSPFGLEDMVGNAYEITRSVTPEFETVVYRGGAWYYDAFSAFIVNSSPGDPTQRDAAIGVRVCAPFAPQ
jgi:formylglycine-generating enzyme required for sulfatase activity/predicted Ser/Thr protein kinase